MRKPGVIPLDREMWQISVWAPYLDRVVMKVLGPAPREVKLEKTGSYHVAVERLDAECRYLFRLPDGSERPDPASRFQPEGVHSPSGLFDPDYHWTDARWRGIALHDYVIYELHVGTFSGEGTFGGVVSQLNRLKDLGITAIELMPVAQFPGRRNWGYDGVYPFAVQASYGGPRELQSLVDAAHQAGLAVILDVVYNHLGPEGNYLSQFGPYFTDRYKTPWGWAVNFDGPDSDEVRNYFIENALYWVREFHIDALRLDAVHAIIDHTAKPFLQELTEAVHTHAEESGRQIHVIAESDLNDPRIIRPREIGGYGFDSQWSDDFHHSLHAVLTGERDGYYADFGLVADLAIVYETGYRYTGQYSAHRKRRFGADPAGLGGEKFVVCSQNHDQVGNRMTGDRLAETLALGQLKIAAATVILSPFLPMLFMGEEYGEKRPFQYFVSHADEALIESVRGGRKEEFRSFSWKGEVPDPQSPQTFENSRLDVSASLEAEGAVLLAWYRELLRIRRDNSVLCSPDLDAVATTVFEENKCLAIERNGRGRTVLQVINFSEMPQNISLPSTEGAWRIVISSEERRFGGTSEDEIAVGSSKALAVSLPPYSCVVFELLSVEGEE